jgi:coenzyme F420-0:L-glutamate ligase/coenzyme F420-1:gamma-L-glutamate ligase
VTRIELVALPGIPRVESGDDLAALITAAARTAKIELGGGVLVVCQKIVSKAEGRTVALAGVEPSARAREIASEDDKDPRHVEVVLRESIRIVRRGHRVLICETPHGFVCANAGVDLSNTGAPDTAVLLPKDPDASARALRGSLLATHPGPLGLVISDSFGRPWREGQVDVALGCAGFAPIDQRTGSHDLDGRALMVTAPASADQLAAAAGLLMRKDAGTPVVWIRGLELVGDGTLRDTLRDASLDLFR